MNPQEDPTTLTLARITFQDPETDMPVEVSLDAGVLAPLLHVTRTWGGDRAHALLLFGAALVKPEVTELDSKRLHLALTAMQRYVAQWDDPVELALAISYEQLRDTRMTAEQAATFAAMLLDKRMTAGEWRKRVDRWAAKRGLPPIETPRQSNLFDEDRSDPLENAGPSTGR